MTQKQQKPFLNPHNRLKSSLWTTIRVKGRNALYGAENALKRHLSVFYGINIWNYSRFFTFHAHTHARIKKNRHRFTTTTAEICIYV
jgi:hypothetical protein